MSGYSVNCVVDSNLKEISVTTCLVCYPGVAQSEDDQDARVQSPTSPNIETSDIEDDDISVGDNCSETSTTKNNYDTENFKKTDGENERSSPLEYNLNNRIPHSNFNSPFKEDENEYEPNTDDRMKFYEGGGIFQLYRSDRDRDGRGHKDEGNEASSFRHMGGPLSESIYGRSMDLTKGSFQSQLLAGFAASVIAGNSQRDSQENTGKIKI